MTRASPGVHPKIKPDERRGALSVRRDGGERLRPSRSHHRVSVESRVQVVVERANLPLVLSSSACGRPRHQAEDVAVEPIGDRLLGEPRASVQPRSKRSSRRGGEGARERRLEPAEPAAPVLDLSASSGGSAREQRGGPVAERFGRRAGRRSMIALGARRSARGFGVGAREPAARPGVRWGGGGAAPARTPGPGHSVLGTRISSRASSRLWWSRTSSVRSGCR